ncbi:MAG TPA: 4-hydroxy-tetrahydrodipicolinate synthase [bacterium]|nr:4-hydroxy-tetrahydrodipicolinate synthase [bacterium]HPS29394.1 4-hydroxy-tetrahydrodipicolinate synthase [bacterium]
MKGVYTAIITPFTDSGTIDFNSLETLLDIQVKAGVSGIVAAGTTGEAATLALDEKVELFKFIRSNCPEMEIIAGTGTNNTADSVMQTEKALNAGISKVLIVTPYYNKPTPKGLFRHYSEIAKTGAEIIVYNVPGRTGLNISPEALTRLAEIENVVAVKEASGDLGRFADYLEAVGTDRFEFLSGDDFTVVPFISMGGKGVISVFTNVLPELGVAMVNSALKGDFQKASDIQLSLNKLNHAMFIETSPLPAKTSLWMMGLCSNNFRAPLDTMEDKNIAKLEEVLKEYHLI